MPIDSNVGPGGVDASYGRRQTKPAALLNGVDRYTTPFAVISGDNRVKVPSVGKMTSGSWFPVEPVVRIRVSGTGALTVDSKDRSGNVESNIFNSSYTSVDEAIEFIYPGDSGVYLRATFPSTLTVEVI